MGGAKKRRRQAAEEERARAEAARQALLRSLPVPAPLAALRERGLLVARTGLGAAHGEPDAFVVAKPLGVAGNVRPGHRCALGGGPDAPIVDAPVVHVGLADAGWTAAVREWIPGPGPGDFERTAPTLEALAADLLDYFFGDPARMNPPGLS